MFSQDAITLALSDAVLALSTGICVPFAKALRNNWIQNYWTRVVLQHLLQTIILFSAICWTFNRCAPFTFEFGLFSEIVQELAMGAVRVLDLTLLRKLDHSS